MSLLLAAFCVIFYFLKVMIKLKMVIFPCNILNVVVVVVVVVLRHFLAS